ncbi:fimbrial protein [Paraburkholderia caribensis]|uniref:fimbrial protein n=1 Tax=Paraburkholderia caribensis TaxID=75105 RepID=UPI0031D7E31A
MPRRPFALSRIVVTVGAAIASGAVSARYSDCSGPLPITISLPSVSVPADLANGQTIPGAAAAFAIPISCTVTPGGDWYITLSNGTLTPVADYPDVYTTSGMGSGVGFRIRNAAGTALTPVNYTGGVNSFDVGLARNGSNSLQGTFELVKIGTPNVGSFGFAANIHVPDQEWANKNQAGSTLNFNYTLRYATVPGCTVTTANVAVTLPAVSSSAFQGVGTTTGTTLANIGLNCNANAKPSISFTDAATPSNQSNTLTLAPGSTASGIGIQILYQFQPLSFGPANYVFTNSSTAQTNQTSVGTLSGLAAIPLQIRYIQTDQTLNPGAVKGVATFNINYN